MREVQIGCGVGRDKDSGVRSAYKRISGQRPRMRDGEGKAGDRYRQKKTKKKKKQSARKLKRNYLSY